MISTKKLKRMLKLSVKLRIVKIFRGGVPLAFFSVLFFYVKFTAMRIVFNLYVLFFMLSKVLCVMIIMSDNT